MASDRFLKELCAAGFAVVPGVFTAEQLDDMTEKLEQVLEADRESAIRTSGGSVYAARNVLQLWPGVAHIWQRQPLPDLLADILGAEAGLVRVLYFDKRPEQTWALPWHKDLTIAVKDHARPSVHFRHPTRKRGVPHVEAPREVLERMLTVRIHLDEVTEENGPLRVLPGSHRSGTELELGTIMPRDILAGRGDVLLIRPLVAHCSNRSLPGTTRHRRVLHLEFAGTEELPDGYAWHDYVREGTTT